MKKIIFILIVLVCYGCNIQRRTYCERKANKVARILKDCPAIIDTVTKFDTVIIRDTFNIVITKQIDSSGIDSLLVLYCSTLGMENKPQSKKDSIVYREKEILIRQYIFKECEKINDGIYKLKDSDGEEIQVTIKGKKISVEQNKRTVIKTQKIIIPCPEKEKKTILQTVIDSWILILFAFIFGIVLGILKRK